MATEDQQVDQPEVGSVAELEIPAEGTKTPDQKDSLLGMLARKRHPGMYEDEDQPEPEPGFTPAEEEPPAPEVKAEEEVKPEPEVEKFEPKHKSWEETEKARREAERLITERAEEAKRAREAEEKIRQELEEMKAKLAEKEKVPEVPPEPVKSPEEVEAEREERIMAVFEEISQLDAEDDPEYHRKLARAWAKVGVGGVGQPAIPDSKTLEEMVDRRLEAREAERTAAEKARQEANILQNARDLAAKSGLEMGDPKTADYILFENVRQELPEEYDTKPLQEQVDWVVGEVRKRLGKVVEVSVAERDKARKLQAENAVLGRGGAPPPPAKETSDDKYTMGEMLRQQRIERQKRAQS